MARLARPRNLREMRAVGPLFFAVLPIRGARARLSRRSPLEERKRRDLALVSSAGSPPQ